MQSCANRVLIPALLAVSCLFGTSSASCAGKTLLKTGGASCSDKSTIIHEHNRLRQRVAIGLAPGQPRAANMLEMIWDEELASGAQRWAEQCSDNHDNFTHVGRFSVGQNMAWTWTMAPPGPHDADPDWRGAIAMWYDEVHQYRSGYSKATGHYTQMVWADTYLVGCGYAFYYNPANGYTKIYVCNYGPSGNTYGFVQPYKLGGYNCPSIGATYSHLYTGLCTRGYRRRLGFFCSSG